MATKKTNHAELAATAKAALARIEDLTGQVVKQQRTTREAWRDYGAVLLEARLQLPANRHFGTWVRAHGLDQGLASSHVVRSDAMWLAANWERVVKAFATSGAHHPVEVRKQARQAGHEWAFDAVVKKKSKPTPQGILDWLRRARTRADREGVYAPPLPEHILERLEGLVSQCNQVMTQANVVAKRGLLVDDDIAGWRRWLGKCNELVGQLELLKSQPPAAAAPEPEVRPRLKPQSASDKGNAQGQDGAPAVLR